MYFKILAILSVVKKFTILPKIVLPKTSKILEKKGTSKFGAYFDILERIRKSA